MKYICLKCKKIKNKKLGMEMVKKMLPSGEIVKVPMCCDRKMEIIYSK